ncbi:MAG: response regulator transcription factor, partial [Anaerolineae bacterium]
MDEWGQILPGAMISVLIADDHDAVRNGLRGLVGSQPDMRVVGDVADGLAAVLMAAELVPDVAVLDIAMPGLNGIDATRR